MKEAKAWLKKAEKDLSDAEFCFDGERYELAAFLSHQAAEKALKALYIVKFKRLWKTHDLVGLLTKVNGDKNLLDACDELNQHYIDTRYLIDVQYTKDRSENAIEKSRVIVQWVKKNLKD